MKIVFLICTFFALSAALPAYATSGKTNRCGCHHSKHAGYHCHGPNRCTATKPKQPAPSPATPSKKIPIKDTR